MNPIDSANMLITEVLSLDAAERLHILNRLIVEGEEARPKRAMKRMASLVGHILTLRDQIAIELQEEPWGSVSQLHLSYTAKPVIPVQEA